MDIETYSKEILEMSFGYSVEKIAEGKNKSPDFLVEGHGERLLIELKSKFDDPDMVVSRNGSLRKGEVSEFSDTTGRKNTISRIIMDASKQLASLSVNVDFRLVWLMAVEQNQKMKKDQSKSSLYGSTSIFDLDRANSMPCYYFGLNDFYRTRDVIDGAIVSTIDEGEFCLNTLSQRYHGIRNSYLAGRFGKACCDPVEEERGNKAMLITDENIDRRDKRAVMQHLREKYGRSKIQDMQMGYYSASVLIPKGDNK